LVFTHFWTKKFEEENGVKVGYKPEQRKKVLNPNERYLEVVVRESAYQSFVRREKETGVDFAEWIKMHVDSMNRCLDYAKPPSGAKAVLKRILVIDDGLANSFWDEAAYRKGSGPALDWRWRKRLFRYLPIDTDESWAIADDYRGIGGNPWIFTHKDGQTVFAHAGGAKRTFPDRSDSLSGKEGIVLDFGLVHEWSHYLLNLPDEYVQDLHGQGGRFQKFLMGTGSFHEPFLSAFLSARMRENITLKARQLWTDDRALLFDSREWPDKIALDMQFQDLKPSNVEIEVRNVKIETDQYGPKKVSEAADQSAAGKFIDFGRRLLKSRSGCWLVRVTGDYGFLKELYLPFSAFNMSRMAGLNQATYSIEFSALGNYAKKTQEIHIVDDSDLDGFVRQYNSENNPPYAKMKIEGTPTWFVWVSKD